MLWNSLKFLKSFLIRFLVQGAGIGWSDTGIQFGRLMPRHGGWPHVLLVFLLSAGLGAAPAQAQSNNEPPDVPDAPTVQENGLYTLTVSWSEPDSAESPITGYDLQYRKTTEEDWTDGPQDQTGASVEIDDLDGDIAYQVRVRAQNGVAEGNWSEPGEGTTALWTTTLTVGSLGGRIEPDGYLGYQRRYNSYNSFGELSPVSVTYNEIQYRIFILAWYRGRRGDGDGSGNYHTSAVDFYILENAIPDDWVLRVGTNRFHTNDGLRATLGSNEKKIYWTDPDISLSLGKKYDVVLSREVGAEKDVDFDPKASLTAEFEDLPDRHDGSTPFEFQLQFSEDVEISYTDFYDEVFELTEGTVENARRLKSLSNADWEIIIRPNGDDTVSIVLPANRTCGETGAICTARAKKLSERVVADVSGPPPPPPPPELPPELPPPELPPPPVAAAKVAARVAAAKVAATAAAELPPPPPPPPPKLPPELPPPKLPPELPPPKLPPELPPPKLPPELPPPKLPPELPPPESCRHRRRHYLHRRRHLLQSYYGLQSRRGPRNCCSLKKPRAEGDAGLLRIRKRLIRIRAFCLTCFSLCPRCFGSATSAEVTGEDNNAALFDEATLQVLDLRSTVAGSAGRYRRAG